MSLLRSVAQGVSHHGAYAMFKYGKGHPMYDLAWCFNAVVIVLGPGKHGYYILHNIRHTIH